MTAAAQPTTIPWTDLPGVREAINALLATFARWQQLPARIEAAGHQAMVVENAAAQQNNPGVLTAMSLVTASLGSLQQTFYETSPKVGALVNAASQEGGGPSLDLLGQAVDVYATVETALQGMDANEAQIQSAAPQVLTPQEVASLQIGTATPGAAAPGKWLLWAGAGVLALAMLRRRGRRT